MFKRAGFVPVGFDVGVVEKSPDRIAHLEEERGDAGAFRFKSHEIPVRKVEVQSLGYPPT